MISLPFSAANWFRAVLGSEPGARMKISGATLDESYISLSIYIYREREI